MNPRYQSYMFISLTIYLKVIKYYYITEKLLLLNLTEKKQSALPVKKNDFPFFICNSMITLY